MEALTRVPEVWRVSSANGSARRTFLDLMKEHGLTCRQEKSGHYKIYDHEGHMRYVASFSPSCPYAYENAVRDMAKLGILPERYRRAKVR